MAEIQVEEALIQILYVIHGIESNKSCMHENKTMLREMKNSSPFHLYQPTLFINPLAIKVSEI